MDVKQWLRKNIDGETVASTVAGGVILGLGLWAAKKFGPRPVKKAARAVQGGGK